MISRKTARQAREAGEKRKAKMKLRCPKCGHTAWVKLFMDNLLCGLCYDQKRKIVRMVPVWVERQDAS
jgi:protein-arginine kinase activator protein McsA